MDEASADNSIGRVERQGRSARLYLYVGAAAVMLLIAALTRSETLTEWDSWEYAAMAARARPSGLCLGRWWFLAPMHVAYRIGSAFGLEPLHCYVPMRIAVALMSAGAVVALMHWTWRVTGRTRAAAIAGIFALSSPTLAAYSSSVMTEAPAVLMLALALIGWEAAIRPRPGRRRVGPPMRAFLAGLAFGVAGGMREPALLLCAWPIVSCFVDRPRRRWGLLALAAAGALLALAVGAVMAWAWSALRDPIEAFRTYAVYMADERATYGFRPGMNVVYLIAHLATAMPLAVFALLGAVLWRRFGRRPAAAGPRRPLVPRRMARLALATLPYVFLTWYNPDLSFNYRLLLPLAWILAPIPAEAADRVLWQLRRVPPGPVRRRLHAATRTFVLVSVVAWVGVFSARLYFHFLYAGDKTRLLHRLQELPRGAVVIAGPGAPIVMYLRRLGVRPDLREMIPGFRASPDTMRRRVQREFGRGRRVFVNVAPRGWTRPGGVNPEWDAVCGLREVFGNRPAVEPFIELAPPGRVTTRLAPATAALSVTRAAHPAGGR